jgi:hypothetical protein
MHEYKGTRDIKEDEIIELEQYGKVKKNIRNKENQQHDR